MFRFILSVTLVLCTAPTVYASFILSGTEHLDVTVPHFVGELRDSSTVDVKSGGLMQYAYVYDDAQLEITEAGELAESLTVDHNATATISGNGPVELWAYGNAEINVTGGSVGRCYFNDNSLASFLDAKAGNVQGRLNSEINILGNTTMHHVYAYDSSTLNVYDGNLTDLYGRGNGRINFYGGLLRSGLSLLDEAHADFLGGTLEAALSFRETSLATFHGYDFNVFGDLYIEDGRVFGTRDERPTGVLEGKWFDGTPFSVYIGDLDPTATLLVTVPEPSTLALLCMGAFGLLTYTRRRRK